MKKIDRNSLDKKFIISSYKKGVSIYEISKTLNVSRSIIRDILVNNNIIIVQTKGKRKYKLNENYFSVIDTNEKAFDLGFVFSSCMLTPNGIILKFYDSKYYRGRVSNFLKNIDYKGEITTKDEYIFMTLRSRLMVSQLNDLGLRFKKANSIFPKLDKKFIQHFIGGFYVGNGDSCNIKGQPAVFIIGYPLILKKIRSIISKETKIFTKLTHFAFYKTQKSLQYFGYQANSVYHYICNEFN